MDKHLLSRVVMPEAKDKDYRDLFLRWGVVETSAFGNALTVLNELHFNTWMNLFSAKKWFHYCQLESLYLGVSIKGDFSVEVIGSKRNVAYIRLDEKLSFSEYHSDGLPVYIRIENPAEYDGVYFILRFAKENPCEILSMGWYTDDSPRTENTLAIVTCTYRRENYINRTIAQFERYLNENAELQKRMRLFVIDNGQTLDLSQKHNFTDIFYNINAGGAGGFGRGLIEVCKAKEKYTRCLFMDDDVEIIPESFYRTLRIADYLKEEYQGAYINGAMLDLYNKIFFFENLAVQEGLWSRPFHCGANLLDYNEILRVTIIPDEAFHNENRKVSAGWYYCCFSVDREASINKLPIPIFIRGDDVEWGRRNFGNPCISMNGICIWHAPFQYRVSKITDGYYLTRNMFIVNALYNKNFKQTFAKFYQDNFRYAVATYDYPSCKLINKGLEDVLKGSAVFNENPIDIMNELAALAKEPVQEIDNEQELFHARDAVYVKNGARGFINKLIKAAFRIFPWTKCWIKRGGTNDTVEWYPPVDAFLMKKHVRVYHLLKHTCVTRDFDYALERKLTKEFQQKLKQVEANYDRLKENYETSFPRLTSYEFWKQYLKLD